MWKNMNDLLHKIYNYRRKELNIVVAKLFLKFGNKREIKYFQNATICKATTISRYKTYFLLKLKSMKLMKTFYYYFLGKQ